ncbi:MAG: PQQ-binding-like beta-propeller repeat protein [Planctomycetaceae bacterium]|nr:PQQ-binding-like beta-propeller repeat protein [Planctomycetaceae bacterium]
MKRYQQQLTSLAGLLLVTSCVTSVAAAGDWRQFRGNNANSIAEGENLPQELSGETIAWKAELPGRGLCGPVVIGERVFVTASSGYAQDRLSVLAFHTNSGEQLWRRQFVATGRTVCHEKMCNATPTLASDGIRLFAFYSSNDLICLDLDGNLQWYRGLGSEFPNASNSLGMASSPIVVDGVVVVQVESDAEAFACGIDAETGVTRWQLDRPRAANWTSPTILPAKEGRPTLALLQSSKGVSAIDVATGTEVWTFTDGASTIPSSTVIDGQVVIPSNGLTVLQPSADGTEFTSVWTASNLRPGTASPIAVDGMALSMNSAGVLTAADITNGERLWQARLKGPFSGTPVVAGSYLYAFNEGGNAFVVKLSRENGEIVSELDLTETILCSPAAADNALYIRSDAHLWKFARPE